MNVCLYVFDILPHETGLWWGKGESGFTHITVPCMPNKSLESWNTYLHYSPQKPKKEVEGG